jgi:hypothetical protein
MISPKSTRGHVKTDTKRLRGAPSCQQITILEHWPASASVSASRFAAASAPAPLRKCCRSPASRRSRVQSSRSRGLMVIASIPLSLRPRSGPAPIWPCGLTGSRSRPSIGPTGETSSLLPVLASLRQLRKTLNRRQPEKRRSRLLRRRLEASETRLAGQSSTRPPTHTSLLPTHPEAIAAPSLG